jgi:hypothetical protein
VGPRSSVRRIMVGSTSHVGITLFHLFVSPSLPEVVVGGMSGFFTVPLDSPMWPCWCGGGHLPHEDGIFLLFTFGM